MSAIETITKAAHPIDMNIIREGHPIAEISKRDHSWEK